MMAAPRPMTREAMADACKAFDERHPVGSTVVAFTSGLDGAGWQGQVLEPGAYVLGGHTPVVRVSNVRGCIALTHIRPLKTTVAD